MSHMISKSPTNGKSETSQASKGYSFVILRHRIDESHQLWVDACEQSSHPLQYRVVDLTSTNWLQCLAEDSADCLLAYPPMADGLKRVYDERLYLLAEVLHQRIYPTLEEILVYENKRFLSAWLQANQIPHPQTWVFYHQDEALEFANWSDLPIVAKTAVGALGSGIEIIRSRSRLRGYICQAFSHKGIRRKYGLNLRKGDLWQRSLEKLRDLPAYCRDLIDRRSRAMNDTQRGFVIFQQYVPCHYEWRAVRIGDSYFAHKKLPRWGELISGTSKVGWERPPESLLDFVKYVCDKRGFYSQAIDLFEPTQGEYLVNELQCFFGSHHPHQMLLDGKPGRFQRQGTRWVFEEGHFNTLHSFQLRLNHVLRLLESCANERA